MPDDDSSDAQKAAEQKYLRDSYDSIMAGRAALGGLIDHDLPQSDFDITKEFVFPGHAHTHHGGDQQLTLHAKADAHKDPKEADKLRKIAEAVKLEKKGLLRKHDIIEWREKWRTVYVLVWRGGFQTDVHWCYPMTHWTEQEAKDHHAERIAHPAWKAPKPTMHQFNQQVKQRLIKEHEANQISAARTKAGNK